MRAFASLAILLLLAAAAPAAAEVSPARTPPQLARVRLVSGIGLSTHRSRPTLLDRTLDARGLTELAGSGAGAEKVEPAVALILGLIGFGIGHWYAGDPGFPTWTIIDVVVLATDIVVSATLSSGFVVLAWVLTVLERVFEGISAYSYAGGRPLGPKVTMRELAEPPPRALPAPIPRAVLSFTF